MHNHQCGSDYTTNSCDILLDLLDYPAHLIRPAIPRYTSQYDLLDHPTFHRPLNTLRSDLLDHPALLICYIDTSHSKSIASYILDHFILPVWDYQLYPRSTELRGSWHPWHGIGPARHHQVAGIDVLTRASIWRCSAETYWGTAYI